MGNPRDYEQDLDETEELTTIFAGSKLPAVIWPRFLDDQRLEIGVATCPLISVLRCAMVSGNLLQNPAEILLASE